MFRHKEAQRGTKVFPSLVQVRRNELEFEELLARQILAPLVVLELSLAERLDRAVVQRAIGRANADRAVRVDRDRLCAHVGERGRDLVAVASGSCLVIRDLGRIIIRRPLPR